MTDVFVADSTLYPVQINSILVTPDKPARGSQLSILASLTTSEQIEVRSCLLSLTRVSLTLTYKQNGSTLDAVASYGGLDMHKTLNLCDLDQT